MKVGDIVVDRYSKATSLKRKVYRIVHINPSIYSSNRIITTSPTGRQRQFSSEWHLIPIHQYSDTLISKVNEAQRDEMRAQQKVREARQSVEEFRKEQDLVSKWFPKV